MRWVAAPLVLISGVVGFLAGWQRWWPACPPGGFDTEACLRLQDHLYDVAPVSAPWEPLGVAAQLSGASLVVLALAMYPLIVTVSGGGPMWNCLLLAAPLTAALIVMGSHDVASGLAGRPVTIPGETLAALVWMLGSFALVLTALAALDRPALKRRTAAAMIVLLSTPLPLYFASGVVLLGYYSHDTTPWSESIGGLFLMLAGLLLAATPLTDGPATPGPRPREPRERDAAAESLPSA